MFFRSETAPTEPSVEKEEGEGSSEISSINADADKWLQENYTPPEP
jgi:hypothetical protein